MKLIASKDEQDKIDREAADWVVRMEDGERPTGAKEQSRWFGWLQRSPRHVQSYFDTADLYERLGKMDWDNRIDVDEWLAGGHVAVSSIAPRAVVEAQRPARPFIGYALAASVVGAMVIAGAFVWQSFGGERYRTGVGQQSLYRLADGTTMTLNTRSQAKVDFTDTQRLIELQGEALFSVASDVNRPFFVRTSNATVRVIGTKFNVYGLEGETRVAVVEGRVQLSSGPQTPQSLSAGESAHVSGTKIAKHAQSNVNSTVAWQQQKLVFEDAPLFEVAAEFNRYHKSQIQIRGSLGTTKRLSGTFDALHPQSLLLYLRKDPELTVIEKSDGAIISAVELN